MKTEIMLQAKKLLQEHSQVSDYKLNVVKKNSFELYYVKGSLETVRAADTCDRKITVYADHDGFRGDSEFYVYPSTTLSELQEKLEEAVRNARMMKNPPYALPRAETQEVILPSNLSETPMPVLADQIARQVFAANTLRDGSLNSVEIFLNHYEDAVENSSGLQKTQQRWDAMVEAIPTFNGSKESVELYEQYHFSALDMDALKKEIADKMDAVQARYEARKPDFSMDCPVVLHKQELCEFFTALSEDLNYSTVYNHGNCYEKGSDLQQNRLGDPLTLSMHGALEGNSASSSFDGDGLSLGEITLVKDGMVENYYGSSRFGQYLQEAPTGNLGCISVAPGSFCQVEDRPYLEVLSMSGLQVDFFNDYIGGEIRLAYYHDGTKKLPVTGISIAGKVSDAFRHIRFSRETAVHDSYSGPESAMLDDLKIF